MVTNLKPNDVTITMDNFPPSENEFNKIDEVKKNKKKYPSFFRNLRYFFRQYCDYTSVHGMKYLGEKTSSNSEKFCWLAIFSISVFFCVSSIMAAYVKWEKSPFILQFARSPTPIWKVPFPAVTICSENVARQRSYNFTKNYRKYFSKNSERNMTEEELEVFGSVSVLCFDDAINYTNKTMNRKTVEFLEEIAPQKSEMFVYCNWKYSKKSNNCLEHLAPVFSDEGVCHTINMLDRNELFWNKISSESNHLFFHGLPSNGWNLDNGYPSDTDQHTFPRRTFSAGAGTGISLVLSAYDQDLDYICRRGVQGFKIFLHNPADVPQSTMQYIKVPLDQDVDITIKPHMTTISSELKGYHPERRQCYFAYEKLLRFYKIYTQQNCQFECLTNHTLQYCGCVGFYMPYKESTPFCGTGSVHCMRQAYNDLLAKQSETNNMNNIEGNPYNCDCLPSCTTLSYNGEASQTDFNWSQLFDALGIDLFKEEPGIRLSRVSIYFKEMQFTSSERNELYGTTDFLSDCGGLLGIFLGFSFLSFIEIIWFLTVRLSCNIKRYGRHFWSGSEYLLTNYDEYTHQKRKNK